MDTNIDLWYVWVGGQLIWHLEAGNITSEHISLYWDIINRNQAIMLLEQYL